MRYLILLLSIFSLTGCLPEPLKPTVSVDKEMLLARDWNLAVLDLNYTAIEGKLSSGLTTSISAGPDAGQVIASLIASELSSLSNIKVVERGRIDHLIDEQQLQMTGIIDSESAVEIGKMLGADAVLVGNVTDYLSWSSLGLTGSTVSFSMRMIDIKSGQVVTSGSISRVENFTVAFQNAQKLAKRLITEIGQQ